MKFTILLGFLLVISFSSSGKTHIADRLLTSDSAMQRALDEYKNAFNEKDTTYLNAWGIKQFEYDSIVNVLKYFDVSCLQATDKNYSVRILYDEFKSATLSNVKMDSIVFYKSSDIQGCGSVGVKKIDAKAYFRKKSIELGFSLLFIRDFNGQYKLLNQILNYKVFGND